MFLMGLLFYPWIFQKIYLSCTCEQRGGIPPLLHIVKLFGVDMKLGSFDLIYPTAAQWGLGDPTL